MTARSRGGRDLRYRSALRINDDLLIDLGPDVPAAAARFGLDLAPLQAVLITHAHDDHLDPSTLALRHVWATATSLPRLHVYANPLSLAVVRRIAGSGSIDDRLHLGLHEIHPGQRLSIDIGGPLPNDPRQPAILDDTLALPRRRYDVWTLAARHMEPGDEALLFAVRQIDGPEVSSPRRSPTILYAVDTGPFSAETWGALDGLAREEVSFNAVILDGTLGLGEPGDLHMNLEQAAAHAEELGRRGLLAPNALCLAHHFSHYFTPALDELVETLSAHGLQPTYDGLQLVL